VQYNPGPVTLATGPNLTASVSGVNPTGCGTDDGTITVSNVTGGTAPYRYRLEGTLGYQMGSTFPGQKAGSYTVYIRDDKNCEITRTIT
jgi:hypothetical protein